VKAVLSLRRNAAETVLEPTGMLSVVAVATPLDIG
jgi:hypothetical protein